MEGAYGSGLLLVGGDYRSEECTESVGANDMDPGTGEGKFVGLWLMIKLSILFPLTKIFAHSSKCWFGKIYMMCL